MTPSEEYVRKQRCPDGLSLGKKMIIISGLMAIAILGAHMAPQGSKTEAYLTIIVFITIIMLFTTLAKELIGG